MPSWGCLDLVGREEVIVNENLKNVLRHFEKLKLRFKTKSRERYWRKYRDWLKLEIAILCSKKVKRHFSELIKASKWAYWLLL
jgi:hypothetical protein